MSTDKPSPFARIEDNGHGKRRMYVGPQFIGEATDHPDSGVVAIATINAAHEAELAKLKAELAATKAKLEGHWRVLLDTLLESPGELSDVARALMGELGVKVEQPKAEPMWRQPHPEYLLSIDGAVAYAQDVSAIQAGIPELRLMRADAVEALYTQFSQEEYSAGWMNLSASLIERFRRWLTHGWGLICVEHGLHGQLERGDKCGPCSDKARQYDVTFLRPGNTVSWRTVTTEDALRPQPFRPDHPPILKPRQRRTPRR